MVSSNLPVPNRPYNEKAWRCTVCNTPFESGQVDRSGIGWCASCHWEKGYRGPQRPSQCSSCFNNVGTIGEPLCAALMYQMADGTWRDRSNRAENVSYSGKRDHNGKFKETTTPIRPAKRTKAEYVCEC